MQILKKNYLKRCATECGAGGGFVSCWKNKGQKEGQREYIRKENFPLPMKCS